MGYRELARLAVCLIVILIGSCTDDTGILREVDSGYEDFSYFDFKPSRIQYVIFHCSASNPSNPLTVERLLAVFKQRKFIKVGYRHFITRDGVIHDLVKYDDDEFISWEELTFGAKGFNKNVIHICYDGGVDNHLNPVDTRTPAQRVSMVKLLLQYKKQYPWIRAMGHNQVANKGCPSFDVRKEYAPYMK